MGILYFSSAISTHAGDAVTAVLLVADSINVVAANVCLRRTGDVEPHLSHEANVRKAH